MSGCGHIVCGAGACIVPGAPMRAAAAPTSKRSPSLSRIRGERMRRSLAEFFRAGWHVLEATTPLVWGPHLTEVCAHVQAVIEDWAKRQNDPTFVQRVRDLLCTLPPGTAKSRIGVYAIPWAWLRWPALRAICLSANPRVALRDSAYAREVIASPWYQQTFNPSWSIKADTDAKGLFANTAGGFRSAMGIDARIVGERADLMWIDDPHDPEEAQSDAQRRSVLERWDTSIESRVNDLGSSVRIGIAHRVHEDDWSSHRIAENWTELRLPMLFEPENKCVTALGGDWRTEDGEVLHAERFPPEVIAKEKAKGEMRWATLFQCRPAPAGGALVKLDWLRFWKRPDVDDEPKRRNEIDWFEKDKPNTPELANVTSGRPRGCWTGPARVLPKGLTVTIAADLAGGKKTTDGDFNVIVALGRRGADFFLLECWRARADFPDVQRKFREISARYPRARKVVEQAASGASLVSSLQRDIPGLIGLPPQGDKRARLMAVLACFEAGNVHFDEQWPGLAEVVHELCTFPSARHDDFVDALVLVLSESLGTEDVVSKWRKMAGDPKENARSAAMTHAQLQQFVRDRWR